MTALHMPACRAVTSGKTLADLSGEWEVSIEPALENQFGDLRPAHRGAASTEHGTSTIASRRRGRWCGAWLTGRRAFPAADEMVMATFGPQRLVPQAVGGGSVPAPYSTHGGDEGYR